MTAPPSIDGPFLGDGNGRRNGRRRSLGRLIRHRLVIPVLRAKHPPAYTARGVALGLALAMTPTVGIQMPIVFLVWLLVRRFRQDSDFNLLVAMAWTWSSNVLTLPPLYYLFLLTGRIMLGGFHRLGDYQAFTGRLGDVIDLQSGWTETVWMYTYGLFQEFGLPMFVGSLPWAVVGGWLGYIWTLRILRRRAELRSQRRPRASGAHPVAQEEL